MPDNNTVRAYDFNGKTHLVSVDKLTWRPGAYGIVIKDGNILLLRQSNGYDLPGGGVDLGEAPEEAVIREIKEESGVDAANPRLLAVKSGFYVPFHEQAEQAKQSLQIYYTCEYIGGDLSTAGFDEYEQVYAESPEWVSLDKLDTIKLGTTIDFRPYVKQALNV